MSFTDPQSPASPPSLSRRTVAHGLAWTVPAVAAAAAAPAFAVSCANPAAFTGRFTQADVYGTPPSTYTWSAAGRTPITLSLNTVADSGKSLTPNNLTSAGGSNQGYNGLGDLRADGLLLQQSGSGGQRLTITFSRPVTNLQFTIADVDWLRSRYRDAIVLDPEPTSVTNGPPLQGNGTTGSPVSAVSAGEVSSDTEANRSRVTYAGPINSFTLYFSSTDGTTAQQIFLTGLTFFAC